MINPHDEKIVWAKEAGLEMSLFTMWDYLHDNKIIVNYSYTLMRPYKPTYKKLYDKHKKLLFKIVEIMIGTSVFTPSEINKKGSNEFYLFLVINEILHIEWYFALEYNYGKRKSRGYEKAKLEYTAAHNILQRYSDDKIPYLFPSHKNEILLDIQNGFKEINRPQQSKKIIDAIKDHFSIKKIDATNSYRGMLEFEQSMEDIRHIRKKYKEVDIETLRAAYKKK